MKAKFWVVEKTINTVHMMEVYLRSKYHLNSQKVSSSCCPQSQDCKAQIRISLLARQSTWQSLHWLQKLSALQFLKNWTCWMLVPDSWQTRKPDLLKLSVFLSNVWQGKNLICKAAFHIRQLNWHIKICYEKGYHKTNFLNDGFVLFFFIRQQSLSENRTIERYSH